MDAWGAVIWQPHSEPRKLPFCTDFLNKWVVSGLPLRLEMACQERGLGHWRGDPFSL